MSKPNLSRAAAALSRMAIAVGASDEAGASGFFTENELREKGKAAHWKAVDKIARSFEDDAAAIAARQFESDRREILAILSGAKRKSLEAKATIKWDEFLAVCAEYLVGKGSAAWRKAFEVLLKKVISAQLAQLSENFGLSTDSVNLWGEQDWRDYMAAFSSAILGTTGQWIEKFVTLADSEGWSADTMKNRIGLLFDAWTKQTRNDDDWDWAAFVPPVFRLSDIAATETMRAANFGIWQGLVQAGKRRKTWVTMRDNRVREHHADAEGQTVGILDPFTVMGEHMQYPKDPNGSAENIVNCRCTLLFGE